MATTELDPLFVKGLRLLHSKSKDSADQLKQLLDDVILQSKQSTHFKDRSFLSGKLDNDNKIHLKKSSSRDINEVSNISLKHSVEDVRERKVEKRQFEKVKQDSTESAHEAKIPKLESPQVFSYYPPSPDIPKLEQFVSRKEEDTDSSDENADADDFAMEMGLACVICKQIDVSHGNQLIECQECHSLYHQECHRPPATDYDVNDPRRVWYCAKCMKNMKKMATKTQKTTKSSIAMATKEPTSQTKCTKTEASPPALILPFKRTELKAPVSQNNTQSSANKPIGLAGLAANLSGRVTTAASSTTTQSSRIVNSKTSTSTLNLKSFSTFSSLTSAASSKNVNVSGSSSSSKSTTSSSVFPTSASLSSSSSAATVSSPPVLVPKTSSVSSTTASAKTGLVYMNAAPATATSSTRNASAPNNGNSGHTKPASCSPLMSADKRVQIMKKKAAKLQEKRRLSTK